MKSNYRHMSNEQQALAAMRKLIGDGWDFADAAYSAASKFKINQAELEDAYDNQ